MDDWLRTYSTTPEVDERLSYAAKIANIGAINSGQIDSTPANLGTVAWTYQAMKGNYYIASPYATGEAGKLHNDWRQMSGESDLGLFGAIRILSADVAVDPVFGLYGYGCNVQDLGGCYSITPTDGVFKRLNLVTQKLHMDINRDRYTGATVSTANDYVGFTLQNQTPSTAHTTTLTLVGLAVGTYDVLVGGTSAGSVTATAGQTVTVPLPIGTNGTYAVAVGSGCSGATTGTDGGDGTVLLDGGHQGADAAAADGAGGGCGTCIDGGRGGEPESSTGPTGAGDASGCACSFKGESSGRDSVGGLMSLTAWAASLARRRRRDARGRRVQRTGLRFRSRTFGQFGHL